MILYIGRMVTAFPEDDGRYEVCTLHRDWLGYALALLFDQLPISEIIPTSVDDLMILIDVPCMYKYGQLADVDIDWVLSRYGAGLAKYANLVSGLQTQAFHLVIALEGFHERLMDDLRQAEVPKDDLVTLKSILEGIRCAAL